MGGGFRKPGKAWWWKSTAARWKKSAKRRWEADCRCKGAAYPESAGAWQWKGADPVRQRADCSNQTGLKCQKGKLQSGTCPDWAAGSRTCRGRGPVRECQKSACSIAGTVWAGTSFRHIFRGRPGGSGSTGFRLSGAGGQSGSPAGSIQKPDRSSKKWTGEWFKPGGERTCPAWCERSRVEPAGGCTSRCPGKDWCRMERSAGPGEEAGASQKRDSGKRSPASVSTGTDQCCKSKIKFQPGSVRGKRGRACFRRSTDPGEWREACFWWERDCRQWTEAEGWREGNRREWAEAEGFQKGHQESWEGSGRREKGIRRRQEGCRERDRRRWEEDSGCSGWDRWYQYAGMDGNGPQWSTGIFRLWG